MDFGVWRVVRNVALVTVSVGIFVGLALLYIPILKQTNALQREIEVKQEAIKKQQELQQRYSDQILALRTDVEAVEREARRKLGLVKPNETIYHFESPRQER